MGDTVPRRSCLRVASACYWLCLASTSVLLLGGCARFDDRLAAPFTPAKGPGVVAGSAAPPAPRPSSAPGSPSVTSPSTTSPPGPCTDPDPAVLATCLEPTTATIGLPGVAAALVAEPGGRVLRVAPRTEATEFARITPAEGRVAALALSPRFDQDRLVFALLVGDGPSRIVRVTPGDTAKPVAELGHGRGGGLTFVDGALTVGVGDSVVRFPSYSGLGDPGTPQILAAGLGEIYGLCASGTHVYATAQTARGAVVQRVDSGSTTTVWTWPEQQSVGGCAATDSAVTVALPLAERVDAVPLADGGVRGTPNPVAEHKYGRLNGLTTLGEDQLLVTTTNRDGGTPKSTDDRAIVLPTVGAQGDSRI